MHLEAHPHGEDLTSLFPIIVDESELSIYSEDDLVEELDADDEVPRELGDLATAPSAASADHERSARRDELAAFHTRDAMLDLDRVRYARAVKAALDRDAFTDKHAREPAGGRDAECNELDASQPAAGHGAELNDAHASELAMYGDAECSRPHARAVAPDRDADLDADPSDERDEDDLADDLDDDPCEVIPLAPRGALTLADRVRELGSRFAMGVLVPVVAIAMLVVAMGGTWTTAGATPVNPWSASVPPSGHGSTATGKSGAVARASTSGASREPRSSSGGSGATTVDPNAIAAGSAAADTPIYRAKSGHGALSGKLNLNTASEDQLMLLPTVGPAKAERIVTWRKKNGGFKRTADLRRVKGFGYKTFKKLEPFLDTKGDTTLVPK